MMKKYCMEKTGVFIVAMLMSIFCVANGLLGAELKPPLITDADFEFAQSLKEREEKVLKREAQLKEQEKDLAEVQKEIDGKFTKLAALQKEITGQLKDLNTSQDVQFRNLIKVYSAMSSTKVAPLLNKMEDWTVTKILRAMKAESVAKIIPKLEPDKAVAVSKRLGMLNEIQLD